MFSRRIFAVLFILLAGSFFAKAADKSSSICRDLLIGQVPVAETLVRKNGDVTEYRSSLGGDLIVRTTRTEEEHISRFDGRDDSNHLLEVYYEGELKMSHSTYGVKDKMDVIFSPDGRYVLLGIYESFFKAFSVEIGDYVTDPPGKHGGRPLQLGGTPFFVGPNLVIQEDSSSLDVWSLSTLKIVSLVPPPEDSRTFWQMITGETYTVPTYPELPDVYPIVHNRTGLALTARPGYTDPALVKGTRSLGRKLVLWDTAAQYEDGTRTFKALKEYDLGDVVPIRGELANPYLKISPNSNSFYLYLETLEGIRNPKDRFQRPFSKSSHYVLKIDPALSKPEIVWKKENVDSQNAESFYVKVTFPKNDKLKIEATVGKFLDPDNLSMGIYETTEWVTLDLE